MDSWVLSILKELLWTIMNNVAMNICVQVFLYTHVFISHECIPRNRIAELYGTSMVKHLRNCCFFKEVVPVYIPTNNMGVPVHIFTTTFYFPSFLL